MKSNTGWSETATEASGSAVNEIVNVPSGAVRAVPCAISFSSDTGKGRNQNQSYQGNRAERTTRYATAAPSTFWPAYATAFPVIVTVSDSR